MTEKQIQNYIWENKLDWTKFLSKITFPPKREIENPSTLLPSDAIFNMVISEYEKHYNSLLDLELIGCEVSLKKELDSTIRADFLGVMQGGNGLTVIELKKSKQTERQAYTELLAYGSHLRTTFAPMSKMDIAYILISPMEERIVREATINSILYDKTNVIALIPKWENDDIKTLTLEPWIPSFDEINKLTTSCFSQSNFDIFKVTWNSLEEWNPLKDGEDPEQYMIEKMNIVSAYASQIMESKGINGFVYTTQDWPEVKLGHLKNGIVIGGINPYKSAKNRHLTTAHNLKQNEADKVSIDFVNIYDIIPELKKQLEEDESNYLSDLSSSWDNEICKIAFDTIDTLTKNLENQYIEKGYGIFNWDSYQRNTKEDCFSHLFNMRVTGLIRDLFFEYSKLDYNFIKKNGLKEHSIHGDLPKYLIDISTIQYYIREFLQRLFNPYFECMDNIEGDE